ncbi:hypothetical protein ZIOFF_026331 [Zingiber officinale]|uniref:Uncharacterized protein n=1 Tax=Zingiber officinale TaxID=94328 RepID=A0A8J5LEQ2_ZINOF|nr:hypothetical protein ZIOFF_026331 [Zingiber officinale]
MAESSDSSPLGFLWRHFEGVKEHWKSNFSFLDYYKKTLGRKEPLPKWTDADVEEFIASDPIYGPQVTARLFLFSSSLPGGFCFGDILFLGRRIGGRSSAIWFWVVGVLSWFSYTFEMIIGFVLATGFGALCGGVLGMEVAEHWKQLYKIDKQAANLRFLYWWEDKTLGWKPEKLMRVHSDSGVSFRIRIEKKPLTFDTLHEFVLTKFERRFAQAQLDQVQAR